MNDPSSLTLQLLYLTACCVWWPVMRSPLPVCLIVSLCPLPGYFRKGLTCHENHEWLIQVADLKLKKKMTKNDLDGSQFKNQNWLKATLENLTSRWSDVFLILIKCVQSIVMYCIDILRRWNSFRVTVSLIIASQNRSSWSLTKIL